MNFKIDTKEDRDLLRVNLATINRYEELFPNYRLACVNVRHVTDDSIECHAEIHVRCDKTGEVVRRERDFEKMVEWMSFMIDVEFRKCFSPPSFGFMWNSKK